MSRLFFFCGALAFLTAAVFPDPQDKNSGFYRPKNYTKNQQEAIFTAGLVCNI